MASLVCMCTIIVVFLSYVIRASLGAMISLLPYNMVLMSSSCGNKKPHNGGSLMQLTTHYSFSFYATSIQS